MSGLLDFFAAGPARIKGLLIGAMAIGALCLSLAGWAWIEHLGAALARAERDRALDQVAVVSAAAQACTASVDHAKRAGEAAVAASAELLAAARRIKQPAIREVERIERLVKETPLAPEQAQDCAFGWDLIEEQHRKAGGP